MRYENRHIALTGFMGSGKTNFGRMLAQYKKWPFIDLDNEIERKEGQSIPTLFKEKGESYFRGRETAMLFEVLMHAKPSIVSLGGGAICSERNLSLLKTHACIVWIKPGIEILVQRLMKNGGQKRPILLKENGEERTESELRSFVEKKSQERQKWYEHADIILNIEHHLDPEATFSILLKQLEKQL